ncbi:hypothetical protein AMATHDRAFT_65046 [Amanita thiersii Skay4041]|uniref:UBR-type domain-containing protein n=1 Tax=Amanita thiersii Skay4041 TaxID=703135 RepID=A0A2A9ND81_9AGAR|nr:hypothetical protein AMATHDRAFT_65046 [Amanita thiersii Skay4041]
MATLEEYISSQDDLLREASLALPHEFSTCTFSLGYIRQAVYLCLTCPEARGLCAACSVACHTDHEQLELFPKRHFRCDCPTSALPHACTLHRNPENGNTQNIYGQNFRGVFCRCGRPYDAKTERETMIQCLMCEDWFHESCCNLRDRPSARAATPEPDTLADDASDVSSDLPPPLIRASDYESFICGSCASKNPLLRQWAATPGVMMVIRNSPDQPWQRLESYEQTENLDPDIAEETGLETGGKRPLPNDANLPCPKKARGLSESNVPPTSICLAPPENPIAQKIFADLSSAKSPSLGTGDLFLTDGFRNRWCRCESCLASLNAHPYLLEEEDTYEPPDDPDSGLSLEELGMRALNRIPRDRAIDGIHAFNTMRNELVDYLRPFAQEGKVVSESDIRSFFSSLIETRQKTA